MLFCTIGYIHVLECSIKFKETKKRKVKIHSTYCTPLSISSFKIGDYGGLPAIISIECSGKGNFRGKYGDWVCLGCKKLRVARGNSDPAPKLMNWF